MRRFKRWAGRVATSSIVASSCARGYGCKVSRCGFPGLACLFTLLLGPAAHAYCISNTCQVPNGYPPCSEAPDTGCPLGGKPFFFTQHCQSYSAHVRGSRRLDLDYEETVSLVSDAMSKWNDVQCATGPCSARAFLFPAVTCDKVEQNTEGPNANVWVFLDDWQDLPPEALAITTTGVNPVTGEVYGSDVSVQSGALAGFDRETQLSILAHEGGHIFGLGHSNNAISIMVEREGPGLALDPTPDDLKGLCELHPPDDSSCDPTPRHGFTPLCGASAKGCTCSALGRASDPPAASTGFLLIVCCARLRWRRARSTPSPTADPDRGFLAGART